MMLATWLIEIYLSKCNDLEDIVAAESAVSDVESLSVERQIMEEDIRNFMTTYQVSHWTPFSAWPEGYSLQCRMTSTPRSSTS